MSRLVLDTAWVFILNIATLVVSSLTLVVLANHLGTSSFGVFSFALAVGGISSQLAGLGLECVIVMNCSRDRRRLETELGNALAVRALTSTLLFTLILTWIWAARVKGEMAATIAVVTASLSLAMVANPLLTSVFRTVGDIRVPWVFLFGQSLSFCMGVLLCKRWGLGVVRVSWVHLTTNAFLVGLLLSRAVLRFRPRLSGRIMWENLRLGLTFNLNQFVSMIRAASGQLVLQLAQSSRALGEYALGLRIANGFNVLPSAIQTVYLPSLHAAQTLDGQVSLFATLFRLTLVSGWLVSGVVFWAADDVVGILFSQEYARSAVVLKILAVWLLLNFVSYPCSMLAEAVRKVGQRCFAQAVSAAVALASAFCLVRWLGSIGAALGDCVASSVLLIHYSVILGRAAFCVIHPRNVVGVLFAIAVASASAWSTRLLLTRGVERLLCGAIAYGMVYVAVCLASKVLTSADFAFGQLMRRPVSATVGAAEDPASAPHGRSWPR